MENGGKREGAGRKPGVPNKSTRAVKELLDECVDFEGLINKLVELVDGVELQESIGKDQVTYTTKPDAYAAKILLEYRFGKPSQTLDINSVVQLIKPQVQTIIDGEKISLEIKKADELPAE